MDDGSKSNDERNMAAFKLKLAKPPLSQPSEDEEIVKKKLPRKPAKK
jgi:hypothetical protein